MSPGKRFDVLDESRSPLEKILRLAWPVTLSMSLHTSYSIVDMFWVSSLGTDQIAAVTLSGLIFWGAFAVSQVFANGSHALVARAFGAGRCDIAGRVVRDCLVAALVTGFAVAAIAALGAERWLRLLKAADPVARAGTPYVKIMAVGFVGTMALFTLSSAFRATGDMITPLVLNSVSCGLNIVLDPLLIFGLGPFPRLGLPGAAVASVVAIFVSLAAGLVLVLRPSSELRLPLRASPDVAALRDVLSVGIPSGLHYILLSLNQTAMIWMVADFGTPEVAATGIGGRITQLSFLPCMGIGAATATVVGQYLGAGRPERASETVAVALRVNFLVTAALGLTYSCFPQPFLRLFHATPSVTLMGTAYLRLFSAGFLFVSATIVMTRVFQGAGDTVWPTVVVGGRFGLFVGLGFVLGWLADLEALGVWLAMGLASAVQCAALGWIYTLGTWKRKRLRSLSPP